MPLQIPFINAYSTLPPQCFARVLPTAVKKPQLLRFNSALADQLGIELNGAGAEELAQIFSGNQLPDGADPLAMAYSGHQFGQLNPQLGDGRAILLGDVRDQQGRLCDIQLKGAGTTPFSRRGDGRCPLGPALREYILCEAMHALGIPTSRALAVVSTGERVVREQLEPGAVFTRVAASHIRVGTFQYFALRRDQQALQALADHVLARHYPQLEQHSEARYLQLFRAICQRQAELIAQWMNIGFIHGVMNTDNMTISGETIDYGPCAFLDAYHPQTVYSSIDRQGRYAYQNQPAIGQWNLARLAEAMLPLFSSDESQAVMQATRILEEFPAWYQQAWLAGINRKLGFSDVQDGDQPRAERLLALMDQGGLDFTLLFRRLSYLTEAAAERHDVMALLESAETSPSATLTALHQWLDQWQSALAQRQHDLSAAAQLMRSVNPAIIPRNHRIAAAIAAAEDGDHSVFSGLMSALADPYTEHTEYRHYQQQPQPQEKVLRTFCGT